MNEQYELKESFFKIRNLYDREVVMMDIAEGLFSDKTNHKEASIYFDSIKTLPRLLADVSAFILGWCHGDEFIDDKLKTGALTIGEIMDALFLTTTLAEDNHHE